MLITPHLSTYMAGWFILSLTVVILTTFWLFRDNQPANLQTYVVQVAFSTNVDVDSFATKARSTVNRTTSLADPGQFVCLYGQTNGDNGVYKVMPDSSLALVQPLTSEFYGQIIVLSGEFANEVLWWNGPSQSMIQPIVTDAITGEGRSEFRIPELFVTDTATFVSNLSVNGLVDGVNVGTLKNQLVGIPTNMADLTNAQVTQFSNIDTATLTSAQWGYASTMDQNLSTTADVEFLTVSGLPYTFPQSIVEYTSDTNPITFPAGTQGVLIELRAAGGGGGGAGSANSSGAGGGAGSVAQVWFTASDLTGHTAFAVTIGTGGAGSAATGSTGGDSELFFADDLVTPLVTCAGGEGGAPGNGSANGGLGGVASAVGGGYKNIVSNGTSGYAGIIRLSSVTNFEGGNGGTNMKAIGGRGAVATGSGAPQTGQFGGGGGGGVSGSSVWEGAAGGDGYLVIYWY